MFFNQASMARRVVHREVRHSPVYRYLTNLSVILKAPVFLVGFFYAQNIYHVNLMLKSFNFCNLLINIRETVTDRVLFTGNQGFELLLAASL